MLAGNPLLWGNRGGSYSGADAAAEMGGTRTEHIPNILGVVVIVAGLSLIFWQKAGFRFAVEASGGRG